MMSLQTEFSGLIAMRVKHHAHAMRRRDLQGKRIRSMTLSSD